MKHKQKINVGSINANGNVSIIQNNSTNYNLSYREDMFELSKCLTKIYESLPENDVTKKTLKKAIEEANKGENAKRQKILDFLKKAGEVLLEFVTKTGSSIATEMIKESLGVK